MNLHHLVHKIDGYLYHRLVKNLSEGERNSARGWCYQMIKKSHPTWTEEQVQTYYENLINVRSYAVDNEGRRI